eukprot:scaffold7385_cov17-Tisochrysis_lutea.AAC.1
MDILSNKWANILGISSRSEGHVEGQLQVKIRMHTLRTYNFLALLAILCFAEWCPQQKGRRSQNYLSAYQGVTVEAVSAVTTGLDKLSPEHPGALHHLAVPHSIVATARDVRNAAHTEYARDMERLKEPEREGHYAPNKRKTRVGSFVILWIEKNGKNSLKSASGKVGCFEDVVKLI